MRECLNARRELFARARVAQLNRIELTAGFDEVQMRIDEAGDEQSAARVDRALRLSRRGDFHCKGGSFLVNNRDVYYCCSVYPPGEPKAKAGLCETIIP